MYNQYIVIHLKSKKAAASRADITALKDGVLHNICIILFFKQLKKNTPDNTVHKKEKLRRENWGMKNYSVTGLAYMAK